MATTVTPKSYEAMRENPATQVGAKLLLNVAWKRPLVGLPRVHQERFKVLPDRAIEHGLRRSTGLVRGCEA